MNEFQGTAIVVALFALRCVLPLALSKQGKLVFHASAVEIDGGAKPAIQADWMGMTFV